MNRSKTSPTAAPSVFGLPFKSAKTLREAQEGVRLRVWRRLEEAKIINQMFNRPEYQFWLAEFRQGLVCGYGENGDENLVRVFSDGNGIRIAVNRALAESTPSSQAVLMALIVAMSQSFAKTYYQAKGILSASDSMSDDLGDTTT